MNRTESNTSNQNLTIALIAIMIISILMRTVPAFHLWPNFTPIAALALFSGTMLWNRKWMFVLPIGAMLISDTIKEVTAPGTGFYPDMAYVYASFFAIILIGIAISKRKKPLNILLASIGGSVLFYLVTNFGAWMATSPTSLIQYSHDFSGLMQSYAAGLPFFRNTLAGDLVFNAVFFGGYYVIAMSKALNAKEA
jgi:hypothetical protein